MDETGATWDTIDLELLATSDGTDRELNRILGEQGDAMTNIDALLRLIATEQINAAWAAPYVAGQALDLNDNSVLAELYPMWAELHDLYEFTDNGSLGERRAIEAMQEAAREWNQCSGRRIDDLQPHFDGWRERRDLRKWQPVLGGRTYDSLNAGGWFRWDDRDRDCFGNVRKSGNTPHGRYRLLGHACAHRPVHRPVVIWSSQMTRLDGHGFTRRRHLLKSA